MGFSVHIKDVSYSAHKTRFLLENVSLQIPPGSFVALLGENGAGKTTLMDLLMGFRKPSSGKIFVNEQEPSLDAWVQREDIAYLSEKWGLPGDWSVSDFLEFNRFFYPRYSKELETELISMFKVDPSSRIFNLSAGEVRRVQVVSSLSINPKLILVDEITAVLDIIGRQRFLDFLSRMNQQNQTTVILATNILENLIHHISHVALISKSKVLLFQEKDSFLQQENPSHFAKLVANKLEAP